MKLIRLAAAIGVAILSLPASAAAQSCTFTLSRTNVLAGPEGPIFAFSDVTASAPACTWTASTAVDWILLSTGAVSGTITGSGRVALSVLPNTTGATRTATITAAGQTITVTQQATACVTSLTPNALTFPYPGFGSIAQQHQVVFVSAPADCHWQQSPWPINLTPNPPLGGVGSATV